MSADCKFALFILHWQGISSLFSLFCCRAYFLLALLIIYMGSRLGRGWLCALGAEHVGGAYKKREEEEGRGGKRREEEGRGEEREDGGEGGGGGGEAIVTEYARLGCLPYTRAS